MEKLKRKIYWRKLDDQAKVFALASNRKYSSIFRISVVLNERVEPEILQKAVEQSLEKYEVFKVKMRKGIFWYYLEENKEKPIVSLENDYPFRKINTKENNDYLFKVSYFEKKINIDFFHALTDGNGGEKFIKEVIYRYLNLKYCIEIKNVKDKIIRETENAYKKSYKRKIKKGSIFSRSAYMIKGEKLPKGQIGINHFNINLKELKNNAKLENTTISMYLLALLVYSIYEKNYKINKGKKPIKISVPINLKKYFETETLSNFFSYIVINFNLKNNKIYTFEDILNIVKKEFERKMKLEKIIETITADAGMTNNIFIRTVPLLIKKMAVRLFSLRVKRNFTMTFSNIGIMEIDEKYKKYIENFFVILAPDWAEKIKCGVCSYEENLVVTFGSILKNNEIEKKFKELLINNNIKFTIKGNGVNTIN